MFYREQRSKPWFVEKYDPGEIYKWKQVRMVAAQGYAEDFKNGPLCLAEKGELVIDLTGKEDVENSTDAASLFAFNPEVATLFLKHIPA